MAIRPSTKLIRAAYACWVLLAAGILALNWVEPLVSRWMLLTPLAGCLWTLGGHIRTRLTLLTLEGDKLRYQTGLLSKSTRTIQIAKIQDVLVEQSLSQRLLGTGNLTIETAGETSRLTVPNIDRPQQVADSILAKAHGQ
jgi:membrane protein YdbS with pleckstrin-like domain